MALCGLESYVYAAVTDPNVKVGFHRLFHALRPFSSSFRLAVLARFAARGCLGSLFLGNILEMETRFALRAATLRPADFLRRLLVAGILVAIMVVGVIAALNTLRISHECGGAFSRDFNAKFDRYHCELVIRAIKGGYQIKIPARPSS